MIPKISIVMPVYNGEMFIRFSIESILTQTYSNFELILVDDCSTDSSLQIMNEYEKSDSRIIVIHNEKNRKLPESLNIGFRIAQGEYFTWTSDDNMYEKNALEVMCDFLEANSSYGLVYSDMWYIDGCGTVIGSVSTNASQIYFNDCIGACFMYRSEVSRNIGEYDPKMFLVEDYDFWIRLCKNYPIYHIPQKMYYYRYHDTSLTRTKGEEINKQLNKLRYRELKFLLENADTDCKMALFVEMWRYNEDSKLINIFWNKGWPKELVWLRMERVMSVDKKFVLFGSGDYGKKALDYLGKDKVAFFVDNNSDVVGCHKEGIEVISFQYFEEIHSNYNIVISVDSRKVPTIAKQLQDYGICDFITYLELVGNFKKPTAINVMSAFNKTICWINENSVANAGIINNTGLPLPYPEVTGYYIPTLIRWGYNDLALNYAKWLCSIQQTSGAWLDTNGQDPYVFDSAQILKGLLAIRKFDNSVDGNIIKGCEWILSNMNDDGRLTTPIKSDWGSNGECSELIHLYCLSPLYEAGTKLNRPQYINAAERIAEFYINNYLDEIMNFGLLSHFYAYVMEALCDIGRIDLAQTAMNMIKQIQHDDGMVPAYKDSCWVCSTGLFQFAIVWYKLGDLDAGNKAYDYAVKLQNKTGGWYGSYPTVPSPDPLNKLEYPNYFPTSEISWAGKYFLDATYYKCKLEFENQAHIFSNYISKDDGRYKAILNEIKSRNGNDICDVGCGKGRYIKNLIEDVPNLNVFAVDLSEKVMSGIGGDIKKIQGSLTDLPFKNEQFDVVYAVESLEHSIIPENALKEMLRITKRCGKVIVLDKDKSALGLLEIDEWEQWFSDDLFVNISNECNCKLRVVYNIEYENEIKDGLFNLWILEKE